MLIQVKRCQLLCCMCFFYKYCFASLCSLSAILLYWSGRLSVCPSDSFLWDKFWFGTKSFFLGPCLPVTIKRKKEKLFHSPRLTNKLSASSRSALSQSYLDCPLLYVLMLMLQSHLPRQDNVFIQDDTKLEI